MKRLLFQLFTGLMIAGLFTFTFSSCTEEEKTYQVTFQVNAFSEPVTDAVVTFNGKTNAAGSYVFTGIEEGNYNYTVAKTGFENKTGSVLIDDDKTIAVDLSATSTGEVSGEITTNTTWQGNVLMNGWIYVRSGAVLTIQPGTLIKGKSGTRASLIIERGAQIMAVGNANYPIVFTSDKPAGQRAAGDWGGVIILGRARINPTGGTAEIEGGVGSIYGGTNDDDNSGKLKYVRIEFAGSPFEPNKEINGLTMGGVGSGTEIEHIQVSYSGDDAYEWFGGSVNAKYLVAYKNLDDDMDTDFGYRGNVQFVVVLRDPAVADEAGDSNGFESDNDASGSSNEPFTRCNFSNVSVFGPLATPSTTINSKYNCALRLRRNTKLSVFNSVFSGYPYGLFIEGTATQANATAGDLMVKNCVLAAMTNSFKDKSGEEFDEATFFNANNGDAIYAALSDIMVQNPYAASPNFMPATGSPLLSGASFTGLPAFFTTTTYVGAFNNTDNWLENWTNFDPQNTTY